MFSAKFEADFDRTYIDICVFLGKITILLASVFRLRNTKNTFHLIYYT